MNTIIPNRQDTPDNLNLTPNKGIKIVNVENLSGETSSTKFRTISKNITKGNIRIKHTNCPTPKNFKLTLKLHQQRMLQEMIEKEKIKYRIGNRINMFVLSDKVGSGKSIDILALICKYPVLDDEQYLNMNYITYKIPKIYKTFKGLELKPSVIFKTNLIVIPHNIFNQWSSYISELTNLSVYLINSRKKISNMVYKDLIDGKYNIVLVKSTMYNDFMDSIYKKYPISNKINIIESEYKDIYKLRDLSSNIERTINKSLYNLTKTNDTYITDTFNTLHTLVNKIDMKTILDQINQKGQTIDQIYSYNGPIFERVIFDEANSIKIPRSRKAYGKINWFVTSSVEDLLNPWGRWTYSGKQINGITGTGFIKDTFTSNSHKYLLQSIQEMYLKNSDTFVEQSFEIPNPIKNIIRCWTPPELLVLNGIASPEVIHALNAGDTESAIRMTNCNVSNETDIIHSTLNHLQESHTKYTQLIEEKNTMKVEVETILSNHTNISEEELREHKKTRTNIRQSLKNFTEKLNNITFKIVSLKERISNVGDKICPVCISPVENPCLTDCCKSFFCMGCYLQALDYGNNKCPKCRAPNRQISNVTLIDNNIDTTKKDDPSTRLPKKSEVLISLIKNKPEGRFLVFSEYNNTFNNVVDLLDGYNIKYNKLSGSSGRITNIIRDYSNNKINVLLLNAKNYGSGLNLQMTTDIIIYHKMSKDLENQVIGRGQRLGRTDALNVHYLYYENEKNT